MKCFIAVWIVLTSLVLFLAICSASAIISIIGIIMLFGPFFIGMSQYEKTEEGKKERIHHNNLEKYIEKEYGTINYYNKNK